MQAQHSDPVWFNRLLVHWNLDMSDVLQRTAELRPQIVQVGRFGPQLYSWIHSPLRHTDNFPIEGLRETLAWWRNFIAEIHRLDARVVGTFSLTYHSGDPDRRLGWFEFWDKLWDEELLGPKPEIDPTCLFQVGLDGEPITGPKGDSWTTYQGCPNNPAWRQVLKAMVKVGIDLGLDGFISVYNFRASCRCAFCARRFVDRLRTAYTSEEVRTKFGIEDPAELVWTEVPAAGFPASGYPANSGEWLSLEAQRFVHVSMKEAFDEIFIEYGRQLKPDLLVAQWNHFGGRQGGSGTFFRPCERALLPTDLWAREETYLWYCQSKRATEITKGHVGDTTLESRYYRAAGRRIPFVPNTYESVRYRNTVADAVANGGVAFGVHTPPENEEDRRYLARYFAFLRKHEDYYHPAEFCADLALVYAHRAVSFGDLPVLKTFKRLGRRLIDGHLPYEVLLDVDISVERLTNYRLLVLPNIKYLSREEIEAIEEYVLRGGRLIATDWSAVYDEQGQRRPQCGLAKVYGPRVHLDELGLSRYGQGSCLHIPEVPQDEQLPYPDALEEVPPPPHEDPFGRVFVKQVRDLLGTPSVETTAPWTVEVFPYIQPDRHRMVVHLVNYNREEGAKHGEHASPSGEVREMPIPAHNMEVKLRVPGGSRVSSVSLMSPDSDGGMGLPFEQTGEAVGFTVPHIMVYNMIVIGL